MPNDPTANNEQADLKPTGIKEFETIDEDPSANRERTKSYLSDGFKNARPESPKSSSGISIKKPTVASEQLISESIQSNSPKRMESWRYGSSLSRSGQNASLPKSLINKNKLAYRRQSNIDSDSDRENMAEMISEHLVKKTNPRDLGQSFGSTAHGLLGG